MTSRGSLECTVAKAGITFIGASPVQENYFDILGEEVTGIASGWAHCIVLCRSGLVFAVGDNSFDQCGLLISKHGETIALPTCIESLSRYNIIQVACGNNTTFFLASNGLLFACGYNRHGELGLGHMNKCPSPQAVKGLKKIESVSACCEHFMVITETNNVYACGYNLDGTWGQGHHQKQNKLSHLHLPEKCVKVCCGGVFNLVISVTGKLYAAGDVTAGGVTGKRGKFKFNLVSLPDVAIDAACGRHHAVILLAGGSVWGFGGNDCGQLGIGSKDDDDHVPVCCWLPDHLHIDSVFAGYTSSGLITKNGVVWLWGSARGLGLPCDLVLEPTVIKKSSNVVVLQLSFGQEYTTLLCKSTAKPAREVSSLISYMLKMKRNLFSSLECPVCMQTMTSSIYMCKTGHSLCAKCKPRVPLCPQCGSPFQGTRNYVLERQCESLRIPCLQCFEPLALASSEYHVLVCPDRERHCPVDKDCRWLGSTGDILDHTTATHPDSVWHGEAQSFALNFPGSGIRSRVWLVNEGVFVVYWKHESNMTSFRASVKQVGIFKDPLKYMLKMKFFDVQKNIQVKLSCISVDTDCIDDVFKVSSLSNIRAYKESCQVAIVKREKYEHLLDQFEALSLVESTGSHAQTQKHNLDWQKLFK